MSDETELERTLSEPTPSLIQALSGLDGDVLVLGAGGKMGPSLARLAHRGLRDAGSRHRVIAVARFSDPGTRSRLEADGVPTLECDLFDREEVARLPDAPNIVYMVGQKFGTTGDEARTWAVNGWLPGTIAERFSQSRIVAFSTGNVYPLTSLDGPGPTESGPTGPIGEYAQSALARERVLEFFSRRHQLPMAFLRLNYAIEPRYGVLRDIGDRVREGEVIDLQMGAVNLIWQRDANAIALRALDRCTSPPLVLNVTGRPAHSVHRLALEFGKRWGMTPRFSGTEAPTALLSDASLMYSLFGPPDVGIGEMIARVADWIEQGGRSLRKPTHFESREGTF